MPRKVEISALNQYRFTPVDDVVSDKYNTLPFARTLFQLTRKYWQLRTAYQQKVQTNDPMRIQLWTNYDTSDNIPESGKVLLHLYTCSGMEIGTAIQVPRNPAVATFFDDQDEAVYVNGVSIIDYWSTIAEGEYYLVLEVPYDEDGDLLPDGADYFISEPIQLKAKHHKTSLVESSSSINRDNIIFQPYTFARFSFRVEAALIDPTPKVDRVVFKDQGSNSVQLSATTYNTWKFAIGYTKPVPYWVVEKMNHYFGCDNIFIDGVPYTQIDGSQFSFDQPDLNFPYFQATIELGEKDNNQNFQFQKGGIVMMQNADDYPYVVDNVLVGYSADSAAYAKGYAIKISSDTNRDNLIADFNAGLAINGIEGLVSFDGNNIIFTPSTTETNLVYARVNAIIGRIGIGTLTTTTFEAINMTLTLTGPAASRVAIVLPTGVVYSIDNLASTGVVYPLLYIPPTAGTYVFEVYHDRETLTGISIASAKTSGVFDYGIANNIPEKLESFALTGSSRITSFDLWTTMANCRQYLKNAIVSNNPTLDVLTNNLYVLTFLGPSAAPGWGSLSAIDLHGNSFTSAGIDAIYNSTLTAHNWMRWNVNKGLISTTAQTPAQSPTSASAPARTILGPTGTGGVHNWIIFS